MAAGSAILDHPPAASITIHTSTRSTKHPHMPATDEAIIGSTRRRPEALYSRWRRHPRLATAARTHKPRLTRTPFYAHHDSRGSPPPRGAITAAGGEGEHQKSPAAKRKLLAVPFFFSCAGGSFCLSGTLFRRGKVGNATIPSGSSLAMASLLQPSSLSSSCVGRSSKDSIDFYYSPWGPLC